MAVLVFFWLIGFDIIYAIQDHDFDKAAGLKSLVVRWGPENALNASLISHMIMLVLLAFFGILAFFKLPYWIGLFIIIGCLGLEHWIVRKRSLEWAEKSFFKLFPAIHRLVQEVSWVYSFYIFSACHCFIPYATDTCQWL